MGCVSDESSSNEEDCSGKVESGRRVAVAVRSLVNTRSLQFECATVLHESLLVRIRRGLGFGLSGWTTSEVCWVSGEWIKSRMYG